MRLVGKMALPIFMLALGALKIGVPAGAANQAEQLLRGSDETSRLSPSDDPWSKDYVDHPLVTYRNCDAARRAGVAPIYRGDPGYSTRLDGDLDGIACEPYRGT
jgi:hypothetical protein